MRVMPESSCMRPRPGWLRGGGRGDRREEDKDRESTVSPAPQPTPYYGFTPCPRVPSVLPVGFPGCPGPPEQRWVRTDRGLLTPCTLPTEVNLFGRDFSPKNSTFSHMRQ